MLMRYKDFHPDLVRSYPVPPDDPETKDLYLYLNEPHRSRTLSHERYLRLAAAEILDELKAVPTGWIKPQSVDINSLGDVLTFLYFVMSKSIPLIKVVQSYGPLTDSDVAELDIPNSEAILIKVAVLAGDTSEMNPQGVVDNVELTAWSSHRVFVLETAAGKRYHEFDQSKWEPQEEPKPPAGQQPPATSQPESTGREQNGASKQVSTGVRTGIANYDSDRELSEIDYPKFQHDGQWINAGWLAANEALTKKKQASYNHRGSKAERRWVVANGKPQWVWPWSHVRKENA